MLAPVFFDSVAVFAGCFATTVVSVCMISLQKTFTRQFARLQKDNSCVAASSTDIRFDCLVEKKLDMVISSP